MLLVFFILCLYAYFEARKITVRKETIFLKNLPSSFDNFTILHISDLHSKGCGELEKSLVEILKNIRTDIAVFTGDFKKRSTYRKIDKVIDTIKKIVRNINTNYGVFGILGNKDSHDMIDGLRSCGIKMLIRENAEIKRGGASIRILGTDNQYPLKYPLKIQQVMKGIPEKSFTIFLGHTPDFILWAKENKIDLLLAGDTHGGQLRLPIIGPVVVKSKISRRYCRGLIKENGTCLYISSGVGTIGVPMRLLCPPEISILTLKKEK